MARPTRASKTKRAAEKRDTEHSTEWDFSQPPAPVIREARVEFRSTSEQKYLIEHAAMLSGMSVTDYVRSTVLEKAAHDVHRMNVVMLSIQDWERFMHILEHPKDPDERLVAAFREYRDSGIHSSDD